MKAIDMYVSRNLSEGSNSREKYIDGTKFTAEQIKDLIDNSYRNHHETNENRDNYYCGITNDVAQNRSRHGVPHQICVKCKDAETAAEVESKLGDMGFDIGDPRYEGNGGADDSDFVYMCHKTSDFKK